MKTSSTIKLAAVLVAAAVAGAYAWTIVPSAEVAVAQRGRAVNAVPADVEVSAEFTLTLSSELNGKLLETAPGFAVGQTVAKGDTLARLDPADINLDLAREKSDLAAIQKKIESGSPTEGDLRNAEQDLQTAKDNFKRDKGTSDDVSHSQNIVDHLEHQLAQEKIDQQQQLTTAQNALEVSARQLSKTTIVSPIDGTVTAISAHGGEFILSGAPLATILSRARRVEAKVSEVNRAGLLQGQKATVRLLSYPGESYEATVKAILPAADEGTQRFGVLLDVKIDPALLTPGLTGTANIVVGERPDALIIPRRALVDGSVLVVENGRIALRKVTPGFQSLNEVEITEGLKAGDLVVVEEMNRFQPGDRVRPSTER